MRVINGRELLWCAEHEAPAIRYQGGSHSCYYRVSPDAPIASCRLVPIEEAEVPEEEPDPMERLRDEHAAEMKRLREAAVQLDIYARHRDYCYYLDRPGGRRCNCGLEEARKLLLAQ